MPDTIRIDRDDRGVATLWLTRAEKHNALSRPMMDELTRAAADLGADPAVRVVILAADGGSFCAGGDLGWMREQMAADDATRREGAQALAGMLSALNLLPKPMIARVQGNAFGGGVGMMAVSDIVVAADTARFGLTEVKLGLIPATIGPYVLARMGEPAARRVFFSARLFDAGEAVDLNLVSRRVAAADLDAAVEAEAAPFLQAAPGAVAAAKAQCRALGPRIDAAVIEDSINRLVAVWQGAEAPEGISAFFDRRKPAWQS
ncbi:crotonase/enoyl-CoA hydratase family protein [Paracoccus marcusii]|uniref:crotonase/enoyl-CoA hydratase family protein n=1 Tax=Paracoccus marcusii TaxID=59779 RepID=UPI0035A67DEB